MQPYISFPQRAFARRHLGSVDDTRQQMLDLLGFESVRDLIDAAVPPGIRLDKPLNLPAARTEQEALADLRGIMNQNLVLRSNIGMGYNDTVTPPVILRNILENPGWYTAYTPYQAEIAQGRLEALINFQTMITDLTGLPAANASLLDEGTAAAEAMSMALATNRKGKTIFVADSCHPQTIEVIQTRAEPLGVNVHVADWKTFDPESVENLFAVVVQYPDTTGSVADYTEFLAKAKAVKAMAVVAADVLSLMVLKAPGEMGADIVVGNTQRFGVPLGFGGPHAAFMACTEKLVRKMPGRVIGISHDTTGKPAYRLSLQTREQHIRRDKATSNICTAQVLLAVMASMYAVYHGPDGLRAIAHRVHGFATQLAERLRAGGFELQNDTWFDTLTVKTGGKAALIVEEACDRGINLRQIDEDLVGISLDEKTSAHEIDLLISAFGLERAVVGAGEDVADDAPLSLPAELLRSDEVLTHPVFNSYHSETEMLRYLRRLETKDLALNESMIALGSCTMKLNATAEMIPVSWPEVNGLHPFAPLDQAKGYIEMFTQLSDWLSEITGFAAVSLQPNAGSQGEYAGLLAIRKYHQKNGDDQRKICLIPTSAHGTNPATAVMVGFKVVPVACDENGNIDIDDLTAKSEKYADTLAALMITYPSTHGVFEEGIIKICETIHANGGQVYMDGANMNAQVGLTSPGFIGADVCHLNLHKTFCIPHGGGGPGVGPIGVAEHLVPFLPGHSFLGESEQSAVSAAPWGSSSIDVISWMYIAMMGAEGLEEATKLAIVNANYVAKRLETVFPIVYRGLNDLIAHECIVDVRGFQDTAGVGVEDIAKRLMDYGYHSPTMSWPVAGTLMIEPTESESKAELDRFCDAMISIHNEIKQIEAGEFSREDNPLVNAPHTSAMVTADEWNHPYSRQTAVFPDSYTQNHKFWPAVSRIDNVFGDRNLVCTCAPMEDYAE
ncbi:aminomethyl-transferring glycine dehydrogenase [Sulfuriroseicoccus oceanibius]|uniref:Glycine dehydrogenase (decarboxylating) n=1 Tax=Sulfuriroseicoccus oceanibius TaxID=2707525 RepID=A0A6B3L1P1_9BACT|nr:aminomethyl-transferring glycine dehydrogenase [Sulfuriroseicoccus oceanibius]QQL44347.1 aminomethyl-transferring glycine dehydrogenase [Sulfuriroseicoccus oceanibius]